MQNKLRVYPQIEVLKFLSLEKVFALRQLCKQQSDFLLYKLHMIHPERPLTLKLENISFEKFSSFFKIVQFTSHIELVTDGNHMTEKFYQFFVQLFEHYSKVQQIEGVAKASTDLEEKKDAAQEQKPNQQDQSKLKLTLVFTQIDLNQLFEQADQYASLSITKILLDKFSPVKFEAVHLKDNDWRSEFYRFPFCKLMNQVLAAPSRLLSLDNCKSWELILGYGQVYHCKSLQIKGCDTRNFQYSAATNTVKSLTLINQFDSRESKIFEQFSGFKVLEIREEDGFQLEKTCGYHSVTFMKEIETLDVSGLINCTIDKQLTPHTFSDLKMSQSRLLDQSILKNSSLHKTDLKTQRSQS
ncbi:hypothetical protein FGO68_gene12865 [Halteria grandinella]|uniref:Uncharacterized protein n=1 Tax=Halteria grandinella TaxID=5974 RepID=A0A8J8NPR2_HALGN|nr:hypothetical protein FGO68_gene12865 [Halteria grandinella]